MLVKPARPSYGNVNVEDLGYSLSFDSEGNLTDKTITGIDSVKQWIDKALRNRKGIVPIYNFYDSSFGIDQTGTSERHYAIYVAELEADIRTTLSLHPAIQNLSSFRFERAKRDLIIYFNVFLNTKEGAESFEYALDVSNGGI